MEINSTTCKLFYVSSVNCLLTLSLFLPACNIWHCHHVKSVRLSFAQIMKRWIIFLVQHSHTAYYTYKMQYVAYSLIGY